MNKRILSFLIMFLLVFSLVNPVLATEADEIAVETAVEMIERSLTIESTEDFLEFAENCRMDSYSQNLVVTLENDIDLSGISFDGVPIFGGTFHGTRYF